MLRQDIVVGRCYVNDSESVIREVVEETDAHYVKYNVFELATGKLIPAPHQICHKRQFARWAHRAASEAEAPRMHPYNPGATHDARSPRLLGDAPLARAKTAITGTPEQLIFPRAK
jgi:hypothetical protein